MYFRFACYMADNQIAMSYFTHGNHFLLVASRTGKGLAQLCMYEASKGQVRVAEEGATGAGTNGKKRGKKNTELKGNGRKTSQDTDNERAKDKKAKGEKPGRDAKTKDTKKGKTEHVKADSGEGDTSKVRDELGPTLEKQYLDMLADEEDVYGQPKKFNLKEEEKPKDIK